MAAAPRTAESPLPSPPIPAATAAHGPAHGRADADADADADAGAGGGTQRAARPRRRRRRRHASCDSYFAADTTRTDDAPDAAAGALDHGDADDGSGSRDGAPTTPRSSLRSANSPRRNRTRHVSFSMERNTLVLFAKWAHVAGRALVDLETASRMALPLSRSERRRASPRQQRRQQSARVAAVAADRPRPAADDAAAAALQPLSGARVRSGAASAVTADGQTAAVLATPASGAVVLKPDQAERPSGCDALAGHEAPKGRKKRANRRHRDGHGSAPGSGAGADRGAASGSPTAATEHSTEAEAVALTSMMATLAV